MSEVSEFRERLNKLHATKRSAYTGPARFTVWLMHREINKITDEELEVLLAQFIVEVSE